LWQVPEPALAQYFASVRLDSTAEHFKQRGLAGAIASNQASFIPRHHGEGCIFYNHASANFDRETLDL
jgi:hypothetical protein